MTIDQKLDRIIELLAQARGRDFLIREKEVASRIQVGISTLTQYVKAGTFPQPVRTRPNRAWRSSQVDRWIATIAEQQLRGR